mgnify:CR=1 FL=1
MIKGEKIRLDIHKILYSVYKFNKTLNNLEIKNIISKSTKEDIALLNNVTLNSMRYQFHVSKIIKKYIKKKLRDHEQILLISSITQIVFLNFKDYAVVNCSVEIAKKLNIYHGLINASLKRISKNKKELKKINIEFKDLPLWFKNQTKYFTAVQKKSFLNNFIKKPNIHIVFKDPKLLLNFEEDIIKTSSISGFLLLNKNISELKSFKEGNLWVQDFSSFFPLYNLPIKGNDKKFLDACAAPGGKSFQLLSKKLKLTLNDKSSFRIKTLKSNLNRLNFSAEVLNEDFLNFREDIKYDCIIIDAPCSSVGTIRKNPEIFFKNNMPDFKKLNKIQNSMLNKASNLLNINGIILYMVCSFLKNETEDQINYFLSQKKEFRLFRFNLIDKNLEYSKLIKKNCMITLPDIVKESNIDGYFAAYLKKIK